MAIAKCDLEIQASKALRFRNEISGFSRLIFALVASVVFSSPPAFADDSKQTDWVVSSSGSITPPVSQNSASEDTRISLEPGRRDMARMGLERKFYKDLQKEVAYQYDAIKELLPGITYSSWTDLTSKALNSIHRMHEYHKAMGVYRASLKRAAVIGTFVSYTIIPAVVGGLTGNPAASAVAATIPWELPIIPIWIKLEIAKQRQ